MLGPLVVGGVVVSMIASPELRKRARKLGVQGIAAVMAASDFANRELRGATNGTGGMASQISNRVRQAAAEVREEWQDFVAEARSAQHKRMDGILCKQDGRPRPDGFLQQQGAGKSHAPASEHALPPHQASLGPGLSRSDHAAPREPTGGRGHGSNRGNFRSGQVITGPCL